MHGDLPGRGTPAVAPDSSAPAAPDSSLAVAPAGRYYQAQSSSSASSQAGQAQAAAGTQQMCVLTTGCLLSKWPHLHLFASPAFILIQRVLLSQSQDGLQRCREC